MLGRHPFFLAASCAHAGERMRDAGWVMLRTVSNRPITTPRGSRSGSWRTRRSRCPATPSPTGGRAPSTARAQELRELLCFEPRGHADMYGAFVVPPTTRARTWACCSGTRTASPPPAGTARSPSARGRSTPAGCRPRRRSADVVIDVPSGRVRPGCTGTAAARWPSISSTCRATSSPAASPLATSRGESLVDAGLRWRDLRQPGRHRAPG